MGLPPAFTPQAMCSFFEHYLRSGRARTSLPGFLSAWRDHATEVAMPYPAVGSAALKQIRKYLRGAAVRYPHVVRRSVPLTLALLIPIAAALGIRNLTDLESVACPTLVFYARLAIAHQACLRPVEHDSVIVLADVSLRRTHARLRVGVLPSARKIKRRPPRVAVLAYGHGPHAHLAVGTVLRVLLRRVHGLSVLPPRRCGRCMRSAFPSGATPRGHATSVACVPSSPRSCRPSMSLASMVAHFVLVVPPTC